MISGCVQQETPKIPTTTQPPETPTTTQPPETPTTTQPLLINFLTYENPTYGIRIKYPQDWTKKEGTTERTGGVTFVSPKKEKDESQVSLEIFIVDISTHPVSLDEYTQSVVNRCEAPKCNIIASGDTILANNRAYKLVYTSEDPQHQYPSLTLMSIWTIKDDKLYFVTYTAESDEYSNYVDTVNAMVDSFEIINKK